MFAIFWGLLGQGKFDKCPTKTEFLYERLLILKPIFLFLTINPNNCCFGPPQLRYHPLPPAVAIPLYSQTVGVNVHSVTSQDCNPASTWGYCPGLDCSVGGGGSSLGWCSRLPCYTFCICLSFGSSFEFRFGSSVGTGEDESSFTYNPGSLYNLPLSQHRRSTTKYLTFHHSSCCLPIFLTIILSLLFPLLFLIRVEFDIKAGVRVQSEISESNSVTRNQRFSKWVCRSR